MYTLEIDLKGFSHRLILLATSDYAELYHITIVCLHLRFQFHRTLCDISVLRHIHTTYTPHTHHTLAAFHVQKYSTSVSSTDEDEDNLPFHQMVLRFAEKVQLHPFL